MAADEVVRATRLARLLADPVRLTLLRTLQEGPASVSALVAASGGYSQPKVSNHLKLLRESGIVRTARQGRCIRYEIVDQAVIRLVQVLILAAGDPRS